MPRTNRSARQAGGRFERQVADYLNTVLPEDIDRRVKRGAKDRGDISGVKAHGKNLVLECKNTTRTHLAGWSAEAHTEAGNDDALAGIIIHKRHGKADPAKQWVTMTLEDLAAILTGEEQPNRYEP